MTSVPPEYPGTLDEAPLPPPPTIPTVRHSTPAPRRTWIWVTALVVLVVVLVTSIVALVAGDWMMRSYEADRLVTRVEASEAAMIALQADLEVAYATLGDPASATDVQKTKVDDMVAAAVDTGLQKITAAGDQVAATRIAPWHPQLVQAREAYLAHNRAWQAYLTAVQEDPSVLGQPQPEINDTFLEAERWMRKATKSLTAFDLYDLKARVNHIFAPPEQQDSGGGGDGSGGASGDGLMV